MCYHVSAPGADRLKAKGNKLKKKVTYNQPEIFHVRGFARPFLPVTLSNAQDEIIAARWKLLPYRVKTEEEAKKFYNTLNAVGESIFEKSSYKNYITKQRGLLYIDGFYEPHEVKGQPESENYYIYKPNKEIFTLGIVYNQFTDQLTGETYPTFSIITTQANSQLEKIHNKKKRMPLIVPESNHDAWLNTTDKEAIRQLMIPYSGELSSHQTVRVTDPRLTDTNKPETQLPI